MTLKIFKTACTLGLTICLSSLLIAEDDKGEKLTEVAEAKPEEKANKKNANDPANNSLALNQKILKITIGQAKKFSKWMVTPDPKITAANKKYLNQKWQGIARILHFKSLPDPFIARGGGVYYSFTSKSHSYNKQPHIRMYNKGAEGIVTRSGFYGGTSGVVVELPHETLEEVTMNNLGEYEKLKDPVKSNRDLNEGDYPNRGIATILKDKVYLLKTISDDEYDIAVAFQVIDIDSATVTLKWKMIVIHPIPEQ